MKPKSHGTGRDWLPLNFRAFGDGCIIEDTVQIFQPQVMSLGKECYIGHQTILKGYIWGMDKQLFIGDGTLIYEQCYIGCHGRIYIGRKVGVGPGVRMLTSYHDLKSSSVNRDGENLPPFQEIIKNPLVFSTILIDDGCDIGMSASIMPGVKLGRGVQVLAGAVVTKSFPDFAVVGGVPAVLKTYREGYEPSLLSSLDACDVEPSA